MPKLLRARPPQDSTEERQVRKLAGSRHAPGDWIRRARMITRSWEGLRTTEIARELQCHPQTVRERIVRSNAEGLGDRPGSGRQPRLTEAERGVLVGLVATQPPGRLITPADGDLIAAEPDREAHWTLSRRRWTMGEAPTRSGYAGHCACGTARRLPSPRPRATRPGTASCSTPWIPRIPRGSST